MAYFVVGGGEKCRQDRVASIGARDRGVVVLEIDLTGRTGREIDYRLEGRH
jgi:hypothetical protein